MTRAIPMIDDLALDAVLRIEHSCRQRLVSQPVLSLAGDVQQALGRGSHEISIEGVLSGEGATDALASLQEKIASGAEATFTADIAAALELEHVVILAADFQEHAGRPGYFEYFLRLRESPPLPEPASLSSFGGLDGFDTGFDTDVLGDIADAAGDLQEAVDAVNAAVAGLEALAALGDLSFGNPLEPVQNEAGSVADIGDSATSTTTALGSLFGGGS